MIIKLHKLLLDILILFRVSNIHCHDTSILSQARTCISLKLFVIPAEP